MEFETNKDNIDCMAWDDLELDEVCVWQIIKSPEDFDGFYRFHPSGKGTITAKGCGDLFKKLKELNKPML